MPVLVQLITLIDLYKTPKSGYPVTQSVLLLMGHNYSATGHNFVKLQPAEMTIIIATQKHISIPL